MNCHKKVLPVFINSFNLFYIIYYFLNIHDISHNWFLYAKTIRDAIKSDGHLTASSSLSELPTSGQVPFLWLY